MSEIVTFHTSFFDTVRALRETGSTVRWIRWLRYLAWGLPPLALVLAFALPGARALAAPLLLLGVLLLLLGALAPVLAAWRSRYENPSARAEQVVAIDASGLLTAAGGVRSFLSWSDVVGVTETERFILIHASAYSASYIPKRAFRSPEHLQAFREVSTERAGRSLESPVAAPAPTGDIGPLKLSASFQWSVRELFAAGMELRRYGSLRWSWLLVLTVVALFVLIPIYAQVAEGGWSAIEWRRHLMGSGPLVLLAALGHPLILLWGAWSQSRTSRVAQQQQRVHIGERGVRGEGTFSSATVGWEAVARAVETRRFFLFFLNGDTGLVLSKRVLAPDEVAATREFLGGKLGFNFLRRG